MSFKGGVNLKPSALFRTHKAGLTFMLKNGLVSLLSCDTTTSFLFILTINNTVYDADLPFVDINTQKALRVIVLKFNILFPQCKLANFRCNGTLKKKKCVSDSIVYTEASVQQYVYTNTLSNPICPGIIFSDYLESPTILLDCVANASAQPAIQYLMTYFSRNKIGLIVMDFVDPLNYSPLSYQPIQKKHQYMPYIGGAILKIAQLGYFNYDMHNNNILVSATTLRIKLIDFGRVVQLSNLSNDLAEEIQKRSPFDIFEFIRSMTDPTFLLSEKNVVNAFALLADIDLIQNNQLFGGMHIQMLSFVKHIFFMNNKNAKTVLYDAPYKRDMVLKCIAEYAKYKPDPERPTHFFNVTKKRNNPNSKYYV
jgi:hypothetical protein